MDYIFITRVRMQEFNVKFMWKGAYSCCHICKMEHGVVVKGSSWNFKTYKFSFDSSNEKLQLFIFVELSF